MSAICSACWFEGREREATNGGECRFHYLETMELHHTITPLESLEINFRRNWLFYSFCAGVLCLTVFKVVHG